MDTVPRPPRPESFHVNVTGVEASGLLGRSARPGHTPDRPRSAGRTTGPSLWHDGRGVLHGARVWWDDWLPVATTGWGALALIAPLLAAQVVMGLLVGSRGGASPHGGPGIEDA